MKRLLATTALLAIATSLLATAATAAAAPAAPKPHASPSSTDAVLRIDAPDHATAEIRQTWEGGAAKGMRQSMNAIFGNKDDSLNQAELDNIANAVSRDLQSHPSPFMSWDGQQANVTNASVTFENGPGAITSTDTMVMVHTLDIALTPGSGDTHQLLITPLWNATLRIEWAPGWFATTAGALDTPAVDNASLTARIGQGSPFSVTLGPTPPPQPGTDLPPASESAPAQDPAESTAAPASTSSGGPRKVPSPAAWALVAVIAGAAAIVAGRKARGER